MPATAYTAIKLSDFISQVSDLLDDSRAIYWKPEEITFATYEALLYWGACTGYWRDRGRFQISPSVSAAPSTFPNSYDMSVQLPALRARTYTFDQILREIQYMLLEAPNGLSGAQMTKQVSVSSIVLSMQNALNRFILDARLPITAQTNLNLAINNDGIFQLNQSTAFLHRFVWQDLGGSFDALWEESAWSADKTFPYWPTTPGTPTMYSVSERAPLQVQLIPPPNSPGRGWLYTVLTNPVVSVLDPATTLGIPNEWAHAVKYATLSQLLSSAGQISDPLRAQYAEQRYQQTVKFAQGANSIIRALLNDTQLPMVPITDIDLGYPNWMNQYGKPFVAGALYDILSLAPGQLDTTYGLGVDLVMSAPLPNRNDYMPIGEELIDNFKDYVCHILTFKCGGKDFSGTMGGYDSFMATADGQQRINKAQIKYLEPLFTQPQQEWSLRQERTPKANA